MDLGRRFIANERRDSNKLIGFLVNYCAINTIKNLFDGKLILGLGAKSQPRGIGQTGETYLVNKDKLMITNSLYVDNASFTQIVDTYPVNMNLEKGIEVTGVWKDYRGIDVVGASAVIRVDDLNWMLISEQDID